MSSPNCIFCSSDAVRFQFPIEDQFGDFYKGYRCKKCSTFFLHPKPSSTQLTKAYNTSYYGDGENKFNPFVEKIIDFFRKRNAQKMAYLFGKDGKVVDVGCGNGNFLHYLGQAEDFELIGIEPEGISANRAAKHQEIRLIRGFLEEDTFEANSIDAVTLIHVFEHLPNPRQSLDIFQKILKKDGSLLIEIPNIDSWQAKLFRANWLHLDPPRHLNMMSPKVLIQELEARGFHCSSKSYFSPQYNPFGVQQSLLNIFCKKREVLYEHLKGNQSYTKEYSNLNLFLQKSFHWLTFPLFLCTDLLASRFGKSATTKLVFKKKA
jgi:2-polyprenyl-3-methyl-5-hydroxy-6-metoxy-1,4-benzoquinol methylase